MERCFCLVILEVSFDNIYLFKKETTTPSPWFSCEFRLCSSRAVIAPARAKCCTSLGQNFFFPIKIAWFCLFAPSYVGKPVRLICVKSFLNMLTYGQACLNAFSFSLGLEQKITDKRIFFSQCKIIEAFMPDVSYIT